jgi:hypothetical protein
MAKKTANDRLAEVYIYIGGRASSEVVVAVQQRAEQTYKPQQLTELSEKLSLGWWIVGGKNEALHRKAVRTATFLGVLNTKLKNFNGVRSMLKSNKNLSQEQLDAEIDSILQSFRPSKQTSSNRQVQFVRPTQVLPEFQPSMQQGTTRDQELAKRSLTKAIQLMDRTWAWIVRAQTSTDSARRYYERCFGSYTLPRYKTVKATFKMIHSVLCSGPIALHLRTGNTVGLPDDSPGVGSGSMITSTINTPNGPYDINNLFAWATPKGADGKPHVYLCGIFYSTGGLGEHGKGPDNIGGVMIHELSHSLCGTQDHVHPIRHEPCYGRTLCNSLAQGYPDMAIENADNYEIFCEDTENKNLI